MPRTSQPVSLPSDAAPGSSTTSEPLLDLAKKLLRHPWAVFGLPALAALVTGIWVLLNGVTYTATSSFLPEAQTQADLGRMAGLAAQVGIQLPTGGTTGQSPAFYERLLLSRGVLQELAVSEFTVKGEDPPSGTMIDLLDLEGETSGEVLRTAVDALQGRISVSRDLDAGIITVETQAPWESLAVQMNRRLLQLADSVNVAIRRLRAREEQDFMEARLAQAREELRTAEDALGAFMASNREFHQSPELVFQAGRLEREVTLRQQVYAGLAQALEETRLQSVRTTPGLTVIDPPEGSAIPRRGLLARVVMAFVLVAVVGVIYAVVIERVHAERHKRPGEFSELESLLRTLPGRVLRPGR